MPDLRQRVVEIRTLVFARVGEGRLSIRSPRQHRASGRLPAKVHDLRTIDDLIGRVRSHRCSTHPIFAHWATNEPAHETVGALFHQIQRFCASTRPGHAFPASLEEQGFDAPGRLMSEIVESESGHGPELATMAGFILNRAAGSEVCADLDDRERVEACLKHCSDRLLGTLPGYDFESGLAKQTRRAIDVFEGRKRTSPNATLRNLGIALALEIISHRHLIPGEKLCLVDSGLYGATFDDPEMHYLVEHFGDQGAEEHHERNVVDAVESILEPSTEPHVVEGIDEFLEALTALWDLLDTALLGSGEPADEQVKGRVDASSRRGA